MQVSRLDLMGILGKLDVIALKQADIRTRISECGVHSATMNSARLIADDVRNDMGALRELVEQVMQGHERLAQRAKDLREMYEAGEGGVLLPEVEAAEEAAGIKPDEN